MKYDNSILQGSAQDKLKTIEADSVDCCITSPPYWALRDYKSEPQIWDSVNGCAHDWNNETKKWHSDRGDNKHKEVFDRSFAWKGTEHAFCSKCNAWKGSLGLEPTFQLYIKHLVDIFSEVRRVLKKSGACWVNLGDTYSAKPAGNKSVESFIGNPERMHQTVKTMTQQFNAGKNRKLVEGIPEKSLCLIPQRFQIAMVDAGWLARNTIIWYKPNCMPSSAKDRFTVDFEYLFFFTKSQRYYFETQYEPLGCTPASMERYKYKFSPRLRDSNIADREGEDNRLHNPDNLENVRQNMLNGLGRIKRCVWKIATQPFSQAHFATFPPALVKTPLLATCPEYICKRCGKAREKIIESTGNMITDDYGIPREKENINDWSPTSSILTKQRKEYKEAGLTDCGCNAGFDGGIVLDPFMGAGTVALVALQNARNFVGCELSGDYIKMAYERLRPYLNQERITEHVNI